MTTAASHDSLDPAANRQTRRADELEHWLTDLRTNLNQDPGLRRDAGRPTGRGRHLRQRRTGPSTAAGLRWLRRGPTPPTSPPRRADSVRSGRIRAGIGATPTAAARAWPVVVPPTAWKGFVERRHE